MATEIKTEFHNINRQFIQFFTLFDDSQVNKTIEENSWSAAQVAEHVIKSDTGMLKALAMPGNPTRKPDERVQELKEIFLNFNTKLQSPESIIPEQKEYRKEDLVQRFQTVTTELEQLAERINTNEIVTIPALKEMSKLELLHFLTYHTTRHLHQLKKIAPHQISLLQNNTIMSASKAEIVQKVNDAFNNNDMSAFLSYCTDDIVWNMVGNSSTKGKDAILKMMNGMPDFSPDIVIEDIFTTDEKAACTGTFNMPDKSGEKKNYSFCDVYYFAGDKIQKMDSYTVEMKS